MTPKATCRPTSLRVTGLSASAFFFAIVARVEVSRRAPRRSSSRLLW